MMEIGMKRCPWLKPELELYRDYHDLEWGVPSRDERYLFEMLCLEGAQAGLSWWTILQKRARYRELFHGFDVEKMAAMTDAELEDCLTDAGIVRHRGKVYGFRGNAQAWLKLRESTGDPVAWLWSFVGGKTIVNRPRTMADYVSRSPQSDALSKALKKAGFKFTGTTIVYAYLQAVGMVNDHAVDCFCATRDERPKTQEGG